MSDDPTAEGFELAIPMVTVVSNGGVHDDASYVCGCEMGVLMERLLHVSGRFHVEQIHRPNLLQADLIAATRGWSSEEIPLTGMDDWPEDARADVLATWARVLFVRNTP